MPGQVETPFYKLCGIFIYYNFTICKSESYLGLKMHNFLYINIHGNVGGLCSGLEFV